MSDVKERPILFSAPMVRAILDGHKTQTRRIVKQSLERLGDGDWYAFDHKGVNYRVNARHTTVAAWAHLIQFCPYGQPGDRLRVKEAVWMWCERRPNGKTKTGRDKWLYVPLRGAPTFYASDRTGMPSLDVVSPETGNQWGWRFKIGRFMPAWASRITLEVTGVRIERLQEISEEDAIAEGLNIFNEDDANLYYSALALDNQWPEGWHFDDPIGAYRELWESINGPDSWADNPWVWVIEFRKL